MGFFMVPTISEAAGPISELYRTLSLVRVMEFRLSGADPTRQ
jgi:hypothetical protein